jgi:hypothetical protein
MKEATDLNLDVRLADHHSTIVKIEVTRSLVSQAGSLTTGCVLVIDATF